MIQINNLTKSFGENIIVNDVNLTIDDGNILGIVGASGAGKSSLIRMINGLMSPTSGTVLIDNILINELPEAELRTIRKDIGMIFQNFNLLDQKDVYNNIKLSLDVAGKDKEFSDKRIKELLELVGLTSKIHAYPKTLFGDEFEAFISENYLNILKDIRFSPADSVSFNMGAFDIVVNGQEKKTHGKGYRALLNSIMILTMRNYINSVARKNPHFYLIDSPLHGLSLPTGIENTNVRTGFFSYLANNYGDDQIIIIENINDGELPENIHTDPNIKVIEFTQDENKGRYGLLNGIKKQ